MLILSCGEVIVKVPARGVAVAFKVVSTSRGVLVAVGTDVGCS
jgi:hypothetical protein